MAQQLSQAELQARRTAVYDIVAAQKPMTVRQVYYQATVLGLVEKTERGYTNIGWDLTVMRKQGELPYEWITDGTRQVIKPLTHINPAAALEHAAENYRKDLCHDHEAYVEFWVEKDALAGALSDVTWEYDVPLRPARGYSSLTFLYDAAMRIPEGKPAFIYHLGDYDPSGQDAARVIERDLREHAPEEEIHFERLAVTPEQIEEWNLPTRPTKATDTRAARFGSRISVELDAIPPDQLRAIVREAIERHIPARKFKRLKAAEQAEREQIEDIVATMLEDEGELSNKLS